MRASECVHLARSVTVPLNVQTTLCPVICIAKMRAGCPRSTDAVLSLDAPDDPLVPLRLRGAQGWDVAVPRTLYPTGGDMTAAAALALVSAVVAVAIAIDLPLVVLELGAHQVAQRAPRDDVDALILDKCPQFLIHKELVLSRTDLPSAGYDRT